MLKYTTSATDKLADTVYVGAFATVLNISQCVIGEFFTILALCMQELCAPAPAPSILFLFCDEKKKNTGQEKETR